MLDGLAVDSARFPKKFIYKTFKVITLYCYNLTIMTTNSNKKLTKEEVRKIADLANIHIDDNELEKYGKWISDILQYVEMLGEVDTSKVEFKSQVELTNILRKDEPEPGLTQEQAVSGRKEDSEDGYFEIDSVFTPSE